MAFTAKPHIVFPFDERKTIAVAEYLLDRIGGKNNYMYLLKLIFFADRYHVRKYLRPTTSDRYIAMKNGAVASYLYDVCKGNIESDVLVPKSEYIVALKNDALKYSNELSPSDIKAINFSLANFAQYGEFALSDITHAYPEWNQFASLIMSGKSKSKEMFFEDFLLNADPNDPMFSKHKLADPYPAISEDERKLMEAEMFELSSQVA